MIATGAVNALMATTSQGSDGPAFRPQPAQRRSSHRAAAPARTNAVVVCRDAGVREPHGAPHTRQDRRRSPANVRGFRTHSHADERL